MKAQGCRFDGGEIANCLSATQFKCHATDNYIRETKEYDSIANCLRANGAFCPTDNSIRQSVYCELPKG